MSFILDALRKSEHERQRHAGPSIAEMPVVRPAAGMPVALIAVGALLAINLAVVLYFLLGDDAPGTGIAAGRYAVRYALRPNDGNHMGVSEYRDFLVLIPASDDPGGGAKPDYERLMALADRRTRQNLEPAAKSWTTMRVFENS